MRRIDSVESTDVQAHMKVARILIDNDDDHWKLSFGLVASLSDSLELLGLALLVTALLTTLGDSNPTITLNFGS